jgi:hypothetical protein
MVKHTYIILTLKCHKANDLNSTYLWNRNLGHIRKERMKELHANGFLESFDFWIVWRLQIFSKENDWNTVHRPRVERATNLVKNTWWCMWFTGHRLCGRFCYFIKTSNNELSIYMWIYSIRKKFETFEWIQINFSMRWKSS